MKAKIYYGRCTEIEVDDKLGNEWLNRIENDDNFDVIDDAIRFLHSEKDIKGDIYAVDLYPNDTLKEFFVL